MKLFGLKGMALVTRENGMIPSTNAFHALDKRLYLLISGPCFDEEEHCLDLGQRQYLQYGITNQSEKPNTILNQVRTIFLSAKNMPFSLHLMPCAHSRRRSMGIAIHTNTSLRGYTQASPIISTPIIITRPLLAGRATIPKDAEDIEH